MPVMLSDTLLEQKRDDRLRRRKERTGQVPDVRSEILDLEEKR